jgi:anti-sigma factor RsiW
MLDQYVEDELDEKRAAQASSHVNACAECACYYEDLKRERQIYFRYFTSLEATPALWVGVRAGIEEIERNRVSVDHRFRERLAAAFGISSFNPAYAAVALALLITFGVVIGVIKYQFAESRSQSELASQKGDALRVKSLPGERGATDGAVIPDEEDTKGESGNGTSKIAGVRAENQRRSDAFRSVPVKRVRQNSFSASAARKLTTVEAVEKAQRQYLNALATLSRDIEGRRTRLLPDVVSQFEKSLADVDRTINATEQAVREQPTDVAAVQYMTAAYAKKIELLRDIASR